jgi:adenylyl-sulfate kinase
MWFEVTGLGSVAGRDVLIATGTPRNGVQEGSKRFVLAFDVEHGTQLRTTTFDGDECTGTTEVTTVSYTPTIHPDIFTFTALENYRPLPLSVPHPQRGPGKPGSAEESAGPPTRSLFTERPTVWLTGLPGAGKTTLARAMERLLNRLGIPCCVLDGDEIRRGLSADLGLSREDRREQARRVAHVATTLADAGVVPIVALVSPYAEDRVRARQIHASAGIRFLEVWVDTPLAICAARDPKGLYAAQHLSGSSVEPTPVPDGSGLTGVTSPYEAPTKPELRVSGHEQNPRIFATQIVEMALSDPARSQAFASLPGSRSQAA